MEPTFTSSRTFRHSTKYCLPVCVCDINFNMPEDELSVHFCCSHCPVDDLCMSLEGIFFALMRVRACGPIVAGTRVSSV